jgi:hypothetical protein
MEIAPFTLIVLVGVSPADRVSDIDELALQGGISDD